MINLDNKEVKKLNILYKYIESSTKFLNEYSNQTQ